MSMEGIAATGRRKAPMLRAVAGAALWLATPAGFPKMPGGLGSFGSLEHVFAFMPLVGFPLALALVDDVIEDENESDNESEGVAARLQPIAAALVVASFFVPRGPVAAALVVGWIVVALLAATRALRASTAMSTLPRVNVIAAHMFLVLGSVWLFLARLGAPPFSLPLLTVMLATVHFHFSGFGLQVVLAATGRHLRRRWMEKVHRAATMGALVGIPIIAIGTVGDIPLLKFCGVASMTASTIMTSSLMWGVSSGANATSKTLLRLASASVAGAMLLASVYGIGEVMGHAWLGIPRMAQIHGVLNAVGFTFCALVGYLQIRSD
jgi:hypothetical protein